MKDEPLSVTGRYSVKATPSGEEAAVIFEGKTVIRTFTGETAWSDAVRIAEDLNLADKEMKK